MILISRQMEKMPTASRTRPPPLVSLPCNTKTLTSVAALTRVNLSVAKQIKKFPVTGNLKIMNRMNSQGIPKGSQLERLLNHLDRVSTTGNGFSACCPAHDDQNPSLSVTPKDDRILVHCHAGCDVEDVLAAINLETRDLFERDQPAKPVIRKWSPFDGEEAAIYQYRTRDGELSFEVVRYEMTDRSHPAYGEKMFLQRSRQPGQPDAGKKGCPVGFVWGRRGTSPLLYRLPRVIKAVEQGETVYLCEGEKDVETLEEIGLAATCSPGGACTGDTLGKRWSEEMFDALAGATVVCLPDNDEPGQAFMDLLATRLTRRGATVRVLTLPGLPPHGDVTYWMEGSGSISRLEKLSAQVDPYPWIPQSADELIQRCEETGDADLAFQNIQLIAALDLSEYPRAKKRLKEATDINLNELEAAIQEERSRLQDEHAKEAREKRRQQLEEKGKRTIRITGRQSSDVVRDMRHAVQQANDPPMLYRRGTEILRVSEGRDDRLRLEAVSEAYLDYFTSESAAFVDDRYKPREFSIRYLNRMRELLELPELRGITRVPVLKPNGAIQDVPGYDAETQLIYQPADNSTPKVSDDPTENDVRDALCLIEEAWIDHPFADQSSRANTLALALTPIILPLLDRANVPLAIISATRAGSGKSLLAEIIGTGATGQTPVAMSAPGSDDEMRKQITALLRSGEPFIVIDDLDGPVDSASLRRALTSPVWSDRVLGASDQLRLPSQAVWCATGNNLRPSGDMVRRCFLIRLDTQMVRPHLRDNFMHQQPEWTRSHRTEFAAALLTLVRYWINLGRPGSSSATLGSFESWSDIIGGILAAVEVEGFLENLDVFQFSEYDEDDCWTRLLEMLFTWQYDVLGEDTFMVKDLAAFIEREMQKEAVERDGLANSIVEYLDDDIQVRIRRGDPIEVSLGKAFASRRDTRYPGGIYVEASGQNGHAIQWSIKRDGTSAQQAQTS